MATENRSKINQLAAAAPPGAVLLAGHLERMGISRSLQTHYVRAGWLRRIGRGAFVRAHEPTTWQGALYALQTQTGTKVHVGGPAALTLLGRSHYLQLGLANDRRTPLHLFTPSKTLLPRWFMRGAWPLAPHQTRTDMLPAGQATATHDLAGLPITIASAERAMMETLYLMPAVVEPIAAREIMGGLVDLRPNVVTALLHDCRSVRVKRLFLMLADRAGHRWLNRVALEGVDLGRGKRSVAGGGLYVPEHRLAVPPELVGSSDAVAGEGA